MNPRNFLSRTSSRVWLSVLFVAVACGRSDIGAKPPDRTPLVELQATSGVRTITTDRGGPDGTCDGGAASACVADARKIAPRGAYRAKLSKEEADAQELATTRLALRACALGNGEGCALVAQYGPWVEHTKYLEKACDLGYVASCGSIGRSLAETAKSRAEREQAAYLLEKACAADAVDWMTLTSHHGGFCHRLYELYIEGLNDKTKAKESLERACAQGDKHKCACKIDSDCGKVPNDETGYFECQEGICELTGGE